VTILYTTMYTVSCCHTTYVYYSFISTYYTYRVPQSNLLIRYVIVLQIHPELPGRRQSARHRRPCQTTAFCRHSKSVGRAAVLETRPLPPQDHKSSLEQSAAQSQTMWAVIWPVQAVTEDAFIRTVRPRRSVNCF